MFIVTADCDGSVGTCFLSFSWRAAEVLLGAINIPIHSQGPKPTLR